MVNPTGFLHTELFKFALDYPYDIKGYFQMKSKQNRGYKETFSFYQRITNVWQEAPSFCPIEASQKNASHFGITVSLQIAKILYLQMMYGQRKGFGP